jgi:hypothetical protein
VDCQAHGVITRARPVALLLMTLLAAPAVLAGCGGEPAGKTASASTTAESPSSSSSATTSEEITSAAPAFPADVEPDTADASAGASVTVSDIRIGRHDGFDRVVFELGGTGTPGWDVQYVDAATSQGSGKPVDVAGDAVLQVTLTGAGLPYETGVEEFSPSGPVTGAGTKDVTEAVFDTTFEGTTVTFVGTRQKTPFRVYLLSGPTRVVLEVADPS